MNEVVFSSQRQDWATPQRFFDALNEEFGFTLDACALPENAKCTNYFTPDDDALSKQWQGVVWMNPPYGYEIRNWVRKAHHESIRGATVVALIPARTDTSYWHDHVMSASEVRLVKGRLTFTGAPSTAPFPSAVVVFRPGISTPVFSAMDRIA